MDTRCVGGTMLRTTAGFFVFAVCGVVSHFYHPQPVNSGQPQEPTSRWVANYALASWSWRDSNPRPKLFLYKNVLLLPVKKQGFTA